MMVVIFASPLSFYVKLTENNNNKTHSRGGYVNNMSRALFYAASAWRHESNAGRHAISAHLSLIYTTSNDRPINDPLESGPLLHMTES
jgi:hypothetical protein